MSLQTRIDKLEQAAGVGVLPACCANLGDHSLLLAEGYTKERIAAALVEKHEAEPHVVDAKANWVNCQTCGRPFVIVVTHVDNWRPGGGKDYADELTA